jgi:processive 1,2-diacylglycerol beta-glucosyltransferase
MVQLIDKETGRPVGTVSEAQIEALRAGLEEEGLDDQDYYINLATLEFLEERGADAGLIALLREALGGREEMEIQWSPE